MRRMARTCITMVCGSLFVWIGSAAMPESGSVTDQGLVELGQQLFFDTNLSARRNQSCATCHDPARAFTDTRTGGVHGAASTGSDGWSMGDRNTPTLGYVAHVPAAHRDADGQPVGGLFRDGRADDLEAQASEPLFNAAEMAMPDADALVQRLAERTHYQQTFIDLFGEQVWQSPTAVVRGVTRALTAFQQSQFLSPFDSRYDRYLRGEYTPTLEESVGMGLFFSSDFTNCSHCHQGRHVPFVAGETFSNHRYENIGVPINPLLRQVNGFGMGHVDRGVAASGLPDEWTGRFRVPTLRNVAVTAPYMRNGVFRDLHTVLAFYNHYNVSGEASMTNPETGLAWGDPEVGATVATGILRDAIPLDSRQIDALVAFLRMLTDQRYEHLLD